MFTTTDSMISALLALIVNNYLSPFLAPLALLLIRGKPELAVCLLINAGYALIKGVSIALYAGTLLANKDGSAFTMRSLSNSMVITIENYGKEMSIVALTFGTVLVVIYALPQLFFGIKLIREAKKATPRRPETPVFRRPHNGV